jgi:TPP-dependent pyruvate/acetoin dehydrogenase alpha subunit
MAAYRTQADTDPPQDPLALQGARLLERGETTASELGEIYTAAVDEVAAAVAQAKDAPDAGPDELGLEEVYA